MEQTVENTIIPFGDGDGDSQSLGAIMRSLASVLTEVSSKMDEVSSESRSAREEARSTTMRVTSIGDELGLVKDDVAELKDNQFVEPWQDTNINRAARIRVSRLLGIKWEKGGVTRECVGDYQRYFGKFCRALHSDAKKMGLEGPKIHQTQRKNYAKLIEFIGNWVPVRGVEGQKEYYDELAGS